MLSRLCSPSAETFAFGVVLLVRLAKLFEPALHFCADPSRPIDGVIGGCENRIHLLFGEGGHPKPILSSSTAPN